MNVLVVAGAVAVAVFLLLGWAAHRLGSLAVFGVTGYAKAYARNCLFHASTYRTRFPGAPSADVYRHVVKMRRGFEPMAASFLEQISQSLFDSLNTLVAQMALVEYWRRTGNRSDSDAVVKIFDAVGSVIPGSALQLFQSLAKWKALDPDLLRALADRLASVGNAADFAQLCEQAGILEKNIVAIGPFAGDQDVVLGMLATTLTTYASHVGGRERRFPEARRAAGLALLLKPRYVPAWAVMALAAYNGGDCAAALAWADKVLQFEPNPSTDDPWERSLVSGAIDVAEAVDGLCSMMREIKEACSGAGTQ
jgi:hypothetical protein